MKRALLILLTAVGFACGSSNNSGSIPGGGSVATEAAYVIAPTTCTISNASVGVAALVVVQSDRSISNACTAATNACVQYKNMNTAAILVLNVNPAGAATAVGTGTYTVPSQATVSFTSFDGSCNATDQTASAGTVTITSAGSTAAGSYNVTVNGSARSGSFSASVCGNSITGDLCTGQGFGGTCNTTKTCQ